MALEISMSVYKDMMFLRFDGELDESNIISLRERISSYLQIYQIKHLIFNFKKLSFLDSSGIGFIIGRYHQIRKNNGDVTIVHLNERLEKIVKCSGLLKICKIRDTEESVKLLEGYR